MTSHHIISFYMFHNSPIERCFIFPNNILVLYIIDDVIRQETTYKSVFLR